jgi:hypothetical protein
MTQDEVWAAPNMLSLLSICVRVKEWGGKIEGYTHS